MATRDAWAAQLAEVPWQTQAELLAERLGLEVGERRLELVFSHGALRKVFVHVGPVGMEELSYLLAGERPPQLGRRG